MAYKVIFEKSADKSFSKLDAPIKKRIADFLRELEKNTNPRHTGKALQGETHLWRYRVGDYRIVANIEDKTVTIMVIKIGHRREVYR